MRSWRVAIVLAVISLLLAFALAAAQEPVRSFDQLDTRLKPGDKVWVTDAKGRETEGKIQTLAPDTLTLRGDGARTFASRDVSLIRHRRPDGIWNGALIGLAVGGGIAAAGCIAIAGEDDAGAWCAMGLIGYGVFGTGIGMAVDAIVPGKKIVAYRAPGAAGRPEARLSIAPVITPRAKGVALSFAF